MEPMPGESFWVLQNELKWAGRAPFEVEATVGMTVTVTKGKHRGKVGRVQQADGYTEAVQVRTGDPAAWAAYDEETRRMLESHFR